MIKQLCGVLAWHEAFGHIPLGSAERVEAHAEEIERAFALGEVVGRALGRADVGARAVARVLADILPDVIRSPSPA